ncbi:Uncharacterised protein [Escherichia coli]|uniref:Uncharacterized protein n=1 Tax=Escherichia coli TaxID=562 RepID=A0A376RRW1_ECOLX|nr:Uncharacterised protein [Escherichia coli]
MAIAPINTIKMPLFYWDEIVDLITEQAKSSSEIKFYAGGRRVYRAKADDDMITISGMEG